MKLKSSIKIAIVCAVLISANASATVSGKQPERPVTESSVSWYQSVMDYFGF